MNFKKLISLFLAVLMLCSVLTSLSVITVSAEEAGDGATTDAPADDGAAEGEETEDTGRMDYMNEIFASPEDKLVTMKKMTTKGNFEIYADEASGEVAVKNLTTGQVMFTNPYDIGTTTSSEDTKKELLSQIIVKFSENGREKEFTSYEQAAMKDQIKVKNIKNGIRVEYTIGREEARRLVPRRIRSERFEELIKAPMEEYYGVSYEDALIYRNDSSHPLQSPSFLLCKCLVYFQEKALANCTSDRLKEDMLNTFPIVEKMDIYVLDPSATVNEIERIEEIIKTACPNYSYEEMDADHQETEYVSEEENPPVFKMALEYTLDEQGLSVRLPANGIRFNEAKFQLLNVAVLPYMGAGNRNYEGYTFYPDGSGALFAFEDLVDTNTTAVTSKVYGVDYAYHKITGTYQQTVRYPVFGVIENTRYYDCTFPNPVTEMNETIRVNGVIYDAVESENTASPAYKAYSDTILGADVEESTVKNGYVAIIEEGDALTELVNYHAGVLSPYNTIKMQFSPRPQDTYNVAEAISVGTNSEWTVVSERKYVGNYKVRYIMLSEQSGTDAKTTQYEASWLGMAKAYRDYLIGKGVLTALDKAATSNDIPLYIESFGAMETVEKILSIPVEVKKPLTSTDNVIKMYEELSDAGVKNVNFKLTGFANGGMYSKAAYKLKWEKAVQEENDIQDLYNYAADVENGQLGIYPDFDFSYVISTGAFDGFSMRNHAVRTIDDRYSYKREWIPTQQRYGGYYQLAISPAYFSLFYEKLIAEYLEIDNATGISVGSLGNALNSDFDEDEPYNREDSKSFVSAALDFISGGDDANAHDLSVMVDGGNAYTWKYANHILGAPLDSSRYISASYSVPFVGVVLHGYMNFAGSPLNMEGDLNYAKLKAIENGASVYFTLSYDNTEILKEDENLNKYYSIRYDIWKDDIVEIYNELNTELKDVQNKPIVNHEFLIGLRVPDTAELDRDVTAAFNEALKYQENILENKEKEEAEAVADVLDRVAEVEAVAERFVETVIDHYESFNGAANLVADGNKNFETRFSTYNEAKMVHDTIEAEYQKANDAGKAALEKDLLAAKSALDSAQNGLRKSIDQLSKELAIIFNEYETLTQLYKDAQAGFSLVDSIEGRPQSIINELKGHLDRYEVLMAREMGIQLDHSVDKIAVDLFLRTHVSTLLASCYADGDTTKAEKVYGLLEGGEYGLLITELELLRYLDANRNLTDDQLISKYSLNANKPSMDGLVLYVQELLGTENRFDPMLDEAGVKANITEYYTYMLLSAVDALGKNGPLPTLNFKPTYVTEGGRPASNASNIDGVTQLIQSAIKEAVAAGREDGKTHLDEILTAAAQKALVDDLVKIVNRNVASKENPTPEYSVEYLTPETLEADLTVYMEAYFYGTQIKTVTKEALDEDVKLHILTVDYKTDKSIALLVESYMAKHPAAEKDVVLSTAYDALTTDSSYKTVIADLAATLTPYGDVSAELENAFLVAYAKAVLDGTSRPSIPNFKHETDESRTLRKDVEALLAEKMPTATLDDLDDIVALVVAAHAEFEVDPDYDVTTRSKKYVMLAFLEKVSGGTTDSYYYDTDMAKMDAAVRAKVAEQHTAIVADLTAKNPDGYTVNQIYDAVFAALAKSGDSAKDLGKTLAAALPYSTDVNATIAEDVQAYYCYLLVNSFDEFAGQSAPTLAIGGTNLDKNAYSALTQDFLKERIPELIDDAREATSASDGYKAGNMTNYAMSAFLSREDQEKLADEMAKLLVKRHFAEEKDIPELIPQLIEYLEYSYNQQIVKELDADNLVTFSVAEVYSGTLYEVSSDLRSLVEYYVVNFTTFTKADLDAYYKSETAEEDEEEAEEEASRYISDDGRIVAVTYGDAKTGAAYKTFVLNYNNFSVSVEYDGVSYTIPAYDYVVVVPQKS